MRGFLKSVIKVGLILGSPLILGVFIAFIFSHKAPALPPSTEPQIISVLDSKSASDAAALLLKNLTDDKNSTQVLADSISKKIIEENPEGPVASDGTKGLKAPDVQKVVQDFLEKGAENFDYESLKPKIADADLNISNDGSPEALEKYIKKFLAITLAPLDKNMAKATDAADPQGAAGALVAVYENYMADFLALEVPKLFVSLHKKQLALLGANKKIFELMRDYERDPLTAVLALNALNVVRAESVDVYIELANTAAKNNLKL